MFSELHNIHNAKFQMNADIHIWTLHILKVNCSMVQNAKENRSDVLCINHWKGKSGCVAYSFRYQHVNIETYQLKRNMGNFFIKPIVIFVKQRFFCDHVLKLQNDQACRWFVSLVDRNSENYYYISMKTKADGCPRFCISLFDMSWLLMMLSGCSKWVESFVFL